MPQGGCGCLICDEAQGTEPDTPPQLVGCERGCLGGCEVQELIPTAAAWPRAPGPATCSVGVVRLEVRDNGNRSGRIWHAARPPDRGWPVRRVPLPDPPNPEALL